MGTSCRGGANLTSAPFIIDVTQQHGDEDDVRGIHGIDGYHS